MNDTKHIWKSFVNLREDGLELTLDSSFDKKITSE